MDCKFRFICIKKKKVKSNDKIGKKKKEKKKRRMSVNFVSKKNHSKSLIYFNAWLHKILTLMVKLQNV